MRSRSGRGAFGLNIIRVEEETCRVPLKTKVKVKLRGFLFMLHHVVLLNFADFFFASPPHGVGPIAPPPIELS